MSAQAAQVTTGAVTHYFDGKDAVLEAALEEVVRRILAKQGSADRTPTPPRVDVETFIKQACSYLPLDAAGREEWRVWLAFWGRAITNARLRVSCVAVPRLLQGAGGTRRARCRRRRGRFQARVHQRRIPGVFRQ